MQPNSGEFDTRVAVLVDCENADPDILDYALRVAAQFGRVVLRRGFGSHASLANKWQTVLVQQALPFFKSYRIGVPPRAEQDQAAASLLAAEDKIDRHLEEFLKLRALKSGLMDDLLTGRVRVTSLLPVDTPERSA